MKERVDGVKIFLDRLKFTRKGGNNSTHEGFLSLAYFLEQGKEWIVFMFEACLRNSRSVSKEELFSMAIDLDAFISLDIAYMLKGEGNYSKQVMIKPVLIGAPQLFDYIILRLIKSLSGINLCISLYFNPNLHPKGCEYMDCGELYCAEPVKFIKAVEEIHNFYFSAKNKTVSAGESIDLTD